jgi:capsular exopolysaccharide synthesis family protein
MAILFAQMGVRVLIVDADLRRPEVHTLFDMKRESGLSELLTGQCKLGKAVRPTSVKNLFVISSGAAPPNPAELVGSKAMGEILTKVREKFDYVLIDSPPILPVTDAVLLSTMMEGVVLVVGGQETAKRLVKNACTRLAAAQSKILGVVLNHVDLYSGDYANYYHHYYAYYHRPASASQQSFEA